MLTLNPTKKCENKKKIFLKEDMFLELYVESEKTPILLNRVSKNGLGRFLGEPTLNWTKENQ